VRDESWWSDVTPIAIESVRLRLRNLIKFIDRTQQNIVYTDFKDELGEITEVDPPMHQTGFSPYQYRKKVEAYIKEHEDHIAIHKLKRNIPLTDGDLSELEKMLFSSEEIESRERFEQVYGKGTSLNCLSIKLSDSIAMLPNKPLLSTLRQVILQPLEFVSLRISSIT
jgi:type I restriction enzyme, R subunit